MSCFKTISALLLAASLAACGASGNSGMTSTNPGSGSMMPQPANSLPPGDSVNAPLTGQTGVVGETRVAGEPRMGRPMRASARRSMRNRRAVRHPRAHRAPRRAPQATTAQ